MKVRVYIEDKVLEEEWGIFLFSKSEGLINYIRTLYREAGGASGYYLDEDNGVFIIGKYIIPDILQAAEMLDLEVVFVKRAEVNAEEFCDSIARLEGKL